MSCFSKNSCTMNSDKRTVTGTDGGVEKLQGTVNVGDQIIIMNI